MVEDQQLRGTAYVHYQFSQFRLVGKLHRLELIEIIHH